MTELHASYLTRSNPQPDPPAPSVSLCARAA